MYNCFMSECCRIDRVKVDVTVGTADVTTDTIDLAAAEGFDSVLLIGILGTITDGTPSLKAQQSSDDGSTDAYSDLTGTATAVTDADDDDKLILLDIKQPQKRYIKGVLARGGNTGCVVDGILAVLYDSKKFPVTQSADVGAHEKHVTPIEGTA